MKMSQQMSFFRRAASAETLQQNEVNGGRKGQSPVSSSSVVVRMSPCLPALLLDALLFLEKGSDQEWSKRGEETQETLSPSSPSYSALLFPWQQFSSSFFLIRITIEECSKRSEKRERKERIESCWSASWGIFSAINRRRRRRRRRRNWTTSWPPLLLINALVARLSATTTAANGSKIRNNLTAK